MFPRSGTGGRRGPFHNGYGQQTSGTMEFLDTGFGHPNHVSLAQECARAALIFAFGLTLMRVSGRRTFGKWSALDVIVSITAGSALSRALTGNAPLWGTMAATVVLVGLHSAFAHAAARSRAISRVVEGPLIVLAENGQMHEPVRLRHGVSEIDIREALHGSNLRSVDEADRLVLTPNGRISVLKP
jgi:uncharacterized membrane protein YcaP (DUF421 family)